MKKGKNGFTLVEIILVIALVAVMAGMFVLNFTGTMRKNKESENKNVVSAIENAAMSYVSSNPDKVKNLYNGYGYVDLTVGDLRDDGFLKEELIDSVTGENISDGKTIRISYSNGLLTYNVISEYEIDNIRSNTNRYTLVADSINVKYNANTNNTTWCNENKLMGLYTGQSEYPENINSKLAFLDKAGKYVNYNTIHDSSETDMNLSVTTCNVNPSVPGTYNIVYKYTYKDKAMNENGELESKSFEGELTRLVYVSAKENDLVSFKIDSINNNNPIQFNSKLNDVVITITEYYRGSSVTNVKTVENWRSDYNIDNLIVDTTTLENGIYNPRTAKFTYKNTNSDGSKPASATGTYNVTSNKLSDLICANQASCVVKSNEANGNYVKYINPSGAITTMFRIYEKAGKYLKVIYNDNDLTSRFPTVGECAPGCCNGGRHVCNGIDCAVRSVLNSFYTSRIGSNNKAFSTFNEPNGASVTVSIMDSITFNRVAPSANYLGSNWWIYMPPTGLIKGPSATGVSYPNGYYTSGNYDLYVSSYYANGTSIGYEPSAYKSGWATPSYTIRNVKPIMQLYDATITGGNGTASDPFVVRG